MNPIKAIYCRAVQAVLRAALPVLPYREPEIFHSCAELSAVFTKENIQRLLIVTDEGIIRSGIAGQLEAALDECGICYTVYSETRPNPTTSNVEAALHLYRQNNCQALIAIGGGSSMDCAKAVGARIARPRTPLGRLKGTLRVLHKLPTLIAIPTTAGTGSETTLAAVITDSEMKHKYVMNDFVLIPRYAVLDASLTCSLPPHLTSTTGMDALTHAVEAYIGRSTTRLTRQKALEATRLVFENVENAYRDGQNMEARANMLTAAYAAGVCIPEESDADAAAKFIQAIRSLNACMNIPAHLEGIQESDIPVMAAHAEKEANPLYPVPRLMTKTELESFYRQVAAVKVVHHGKQAS